MRLKETKNEEEKKGEKKRGREEKTGTLKLVSESVFFLLLSSLRLKCTTGAASFSAQEEVRERENEE